MHLFLLFYSNLVVIAENGNNKSGTLSPGQYEVECRGAQGGSFKDLYKLGGSGSKATAQFKVINTLYYDLISGKQGSLYDEGSPDGGKGSSSLYYGCGGGSSSAYIYAGGNSQIHFITAAGGSGASKNLLGAHGGGNNTYYKRETSTSPTLMNDPRYLDAKGSFLAGWAVNGSGGGGGCKIGKGGNKNGGNGFTEIGFSGTSCHSSGNFFSKIDIKSGDYDLFQGDGYVKLTYDYLCIPNCIDCDSSSSCNRCDSSHVLYNDGCSLTKCPESYYNNSGKCYECITNCDQCSNGSSCNTCKSPYLLYGGKCEVTTCPPGTYKTGNQCVDCITNCEQCLQSNSCLKCRSPYVKYQDTCENTFCPDSTYLSIGWCLNCSYNCANCDNARTCKRCYSPYVLYNDKCENSECPDSTYLSDGKCFNFIKTFKYALMQKLARNSISHISLTKMAAG